MKILSISVVLKDGDPGQGHLDEGRRQEVQAVIDGNLRKINAKINLIKSLYTSFIQKALNYIHHEKGDTLHCSMFQLFM